MQDLYITDLTGPGKYVLDHADFMAPTRQHELDHTDQGSTCP